MTNPIFQPWGSRFALARESYVATSDEDGFIPVINSEELFLHMTAKYDLAGALFIPYRLNDKIAAHLREAPREPTLLVYGRPSVSRNAFELIAMALLAWQQADPIRASRWRLVFLGESFSPRLLRPLQNAVVEGKVSLERYAEHLSRASVGVSLMISPHPSYPPLEMAEAGLRVVANAFGVKDPRARYPDMICPERLTIAAIAEAIERAVAEAEPELGRVTPRRAGRGLPAPGPVAEPERIAQAIRESLAGGAGPGLSFAGASKLFAATVS